AMAVLRKILSSEPMSAEAYLLLGNIHLRRGDLDQAVSSLKTALFWDNRLINAHVGLGKIYLQRGDCLQAKNYASSALAVDAENQDALGLQRQVERCSK
ncbi:MAG: tetratricopeptide repeat protein, partial [Acidobacteriota bacterium]|nr:tetratricopeptide repeat protein [Acidobacteriota bacterium]